MIPSDLFFRFDSASYLLLGTIIIFILFQLLYRYRKNALKYFEESVVIQRSKTIFWSKVFALILAWALLVFALMQPEGNAHYPDEIVSKAVKKVEAKGKLRKRGQEVLIFIDASASMAVTDTSNGQSRLSKAKEIADLVIRKLEGENVSLFAFTSSVTQLSPSTLDYLFVRLMLRDMRINEGDIGGTDFLAALKTLKSQVIQAPQSSFKTAIILSDGGDYRLDQSQNPSFQKSIDELMDQISKAESWKLRVDTIGVGSKAGGTIPDVTDKGQTVHSSLQDFLLKKIALKGRGNYFDSSVASDVDIANRIVAALKKDPSTISESELLASLAAGTDEKIYDLYFQLPLGLALLLLAYVFLWPEARR